MNRKFIYMVVAMLFLTGCASQAEVNAGEVAGFWFGLWNGMTAGFAFVGSWFSDDILVYYTLNKGFLYDLGFLMGVAGLFGSGSGASNYSVSRTRR